MNANTRHKAKLASKERAKVRRENGSEPGSRAGCANTMKPRPKRAANMKQGAKELKPHATDAAIFTRLVLRGKSTAVRG